MTGLERYKADIKKHLINHSIELGMSNNFTPEQNAEIYMDEHKQSIEQAFEGLRFITDIEQLENK